MVWLRIARDGFNAASDSSFLLRCSGASSGEVSGVARHRFSPQKAPAIRPTPIAQTAGGFRSFPLRTTSTEMGGGSQTSVRRAPTCSPVSRALYASCCHLKRASDRVARWPGDIPLERLGRSQPAETNDARCHRVPAVPATYPATRLRTRFATSASWPTATGVPLSNFVNCSSVRPRHRSY